MPGSQRSSPDPGLSATELLTSGELVVRGRMPWASNETFLAEVREGGRAALVVYKPRDGEAPLWDFPDGTLCLREAAAYEVSEATGWSLVPPTVLRGGPLGAGSVQLFVDHDPEEHYLTLAPEHPDVFRRVAAFDVVVNNADRKSGHCLREAGTGRIWIVDHGVCFHADVKLRTVIWDLAGAPLTADVAAGLERLGAELDGGSLRARLAGLLSDDETQALGRRAGALLEAGVYPSPGPRRAVPWPPV